MDRANTLFETFFTFYYFIVESRKQLIILGSILLRVWKEKNKGK